MLKHIENQDDYIEYKGRVNKFFKREGINNLSQQDMESESYFSHNYCDCCSRHLGGDRIDCSGYNSTTKEVQSDYSICVDCYYYAEYGQLDDMTMLDYNLSEGNNND